MGWNFILQIARYQRVIAVTQANNQPAIDQYWAEHPELSAFQKQIEFLYFDWPYWLRFWKKGPLLSRIYYYGWQLTLAIWLRVKNLPVDLVHNLNGHNDWTPTFLWLLGKPMVWGPVGHDPALPGQALNEYGWKVWFADRALWVLKQAFWHLDPFLWVSKRWAAHIFCTNEAAADVLNLPPRQYSIMPSVAADPVLIRPKVAAFDSFEVLSVGRFVALTGFTSTVRIFARFYHQLSPVEQSRVRLRLVGSGPAEARIRQLIDAEGIGHCTELVPRLPKDEVAQYYWSASAFLFPSHEGTGRGVAEAMSYGLPVICWDKEGPGRLVHPGSTLRVAALDLPAGECLMADRLYDLFRSPTLYQRESLLAQQRFEAQFSWMRRGDHLNRLYDSVLSANMTYEPETNYC